MSQLSLYQIIHTLDGRILHLEEHVKLLFEAYYEIFTSGAKLDLDAIRATITSICNRSRCPKGVSLFVKIEISQSGELLIEECERSLYRGYTLRCVSPRAATIDFTAPYIEYPTSARESLIDLATLAARKKACDVALRCHNGEVDMIGGAQIFAVSQEGIVTAATSLSVEHRKAKAAARLSNMTIIERAISADEITSFDELFFVDHCGVTSVRSCDSHHLMSIVAVSLAAAMQRFYIDR